MDGTVGGRLSPLPTGAKNMVDTDSGKCGFWTQIRKTIKARRFRRAYYFMSTGRD